MRILFLGNSNEWLSLPPGTPLRHEIVERELTRVFGPVELVRKPAWPTAEFPGVVEKWVGEYSPDVVYINVAEYWCLYESIPLRIERAMPRFGKRVSKAGRAAAATPWVSHNRVFRGLRQAGQSVIAGAVYFTPDEIVERVMEATRRCLRNEGLVVVIDGQRGRRPHATTRRWEERVEGRRLEVHHRLRAECARLHVVYGGDDVPQWKTHPEGMDGHRDGLHQGAAGQIWMANESIELIRAAVEREDAWPGGRGMAG